jgi:hypothetical protein
MWHRVFRIVGITGGVVLALLLVLLLALGMYQGAADPVLDPLRDFLAQTATRFVSKGLTGSLEVGYDLKALLKRRLQVHTVEIVQPRLTLVQEADGSWNIGNVLAPPRPDTSARPQEPAAGMGLRKDCRRVCKPRWIRRDSAPRCSS